MPLSFKPFPSIELRDVERLKSNAIPEGLRIDYKRDLYAPNDGREFLKDISSFGNAQGGYLLIGVDEENGLPREILGVPSDRIDSELQRLENLCRDGIEPRIVGIQMRRIDVTDQTAIIAVLVPKSMNPPHRVTSQGTNRFFVRNSNGKHEASVEELRHLFGFSAHLSDEIDGFVRARRKQIISNEDFVADRGEGRLIIHVVNASTFRDQHFIDIKALYTDPYRFAPANASSLSRRAILEGVVVGPELEGRFFDRTLVFRDGSIEAVYCELNHQKDGAILVPGRHLMDCVLHSTSSALKELSALGGSGPYIISVAIETVKGAGIAFYENPFRAYPTFDRDLVVLPSFTLLEYNSSIFVPTALRPLLDSLWNAVGLPECGYFHGDKWQPPQ